MEVKEKGVKDCILLKELSEEALVENLQVRYAGGSIYTYIGNVVISINPFKPVDIYTKTQIQLYQGGYIFKNPPHLFALANEAYRDSISRKKDQCIIISGESGAGKTEASKRILQFIAAVSGSSTEVDKVKDHLLKSNPILESFGNAKTVRNDNSSRFGKYMDIQFDFKGEPLGGNITSFLLEKSRVVFQANGERNFHIFYQVLNGSGLDLTPDPAKFRYLSKSGCIKIDNVNDKEEFKVTTAAMKSLSFSEKETQNIFEVLSGILHLGNIQFKSDEKDGSEVEEAPSLKSASKMLGCDPAAIAVALTERTVATSKESTKSKLNPEQASFTRDALSKALYHRLFLYIVEKINKVLRTNGAKASSIIGVLDIYGFEIFEINSFEQFCINFCNEKLQQIFIELTLKSEQEEYKRENIEWVPVTYFNNAVICDLIGGPKGIILVMDEEGIKPGNITDTTLLAALSKTFSDNKYFESRENSKSDKTLNHDVFRIKHYAGNVTYKVDGFLEKNKDTLFKDLKSAMYESKNPIIKDMFQDGKGAVTASKRPPSTATIFNTSLAELTTHLMSKNPHYVRCIKPNSKKEAFIFDKELCTHQVRYLGLLENVRVRRAGFAFRQVYEDFLERYKVTCPKTWPNWKKGAKEGCELILVQQKFKVEEYRFGKTKVFLKSPETLTTLEEERDNSLPKCAVIIQRYVRGYLARRWWRRMLAAYKICHKFKRYKFTHYFNQLQKVFKNIKSDPTYGKSIVWPTPPNNLKGFEVYAKKIQRNWMAMKMIQSLSPEAQASIRSKIEVYNIFHGKKSWDVARPFEKQYLSLSETTKSKFEKVKAKLTKGDDKEIVFSDMVQKVSRGGKAEKRGFVVTNRNWYMLDPGSMGIRRGPRGLSDITGISMSTKKDSLIAVHMSANGDILLDLGDHLAEFVSVLAQKLKELKQQALSVTFGDTISLKTLSGNQTVQFQQSQTATGQIMFKKCKGGVTALCPTL